MKDFIFALFLFGIILPTAYSRHLQFFRNDYTYIEEFDAFYKVHWDVSGSAWSTALFTCDDEGATLFYPKAEKEWTVVKNLTDKTNNDEGHNVTDIFVGLKDELKSRHFMIDEEYPTPDEFSSDINMFPERHHENCMTMNIDSGSLKVSSCLRTPLTALPFVCKKVDNGACPTIDHGYKYKKGSKKCYKVHEKQLIWEEALKTCFLEGGILAVVEDSAQARDVQSMLRDGPYSYFVGVRQLDSREDFYTVKAVARDFVRVYVGQKFSDVYQRPNGPPSSFDCGAVMTINNERLYTTKVSCSDKAPFVCEMDLDREAV